MSESIKKRLMIMLQDEEGYRQFPYKCTAGVLTVGIGRNLHHRGISLEEAKILLANDIDYHTDKLERGLPIDKYTFWSDLNDARKAVLIDMCVNLGQAGFYRFKDMLKALEKKDYETASKEMLDSKWAKQVKGRAVKLADMMKSGEFQ
jgi:lysozyme